MTEEMGLERAPGIAERLLGGWRVVAAAWLVAVLLIAFFAGMQALRSHHTVTPRQESLVGAVIPRHDPSCAGPEVAASAAPQCQSAIENVSRAEAEAAYGL